MVGAISFAKTAVAAVAFSAFSAVASFAATFTGDFSLSGSAFSDPGLVINTNPSSGSFNFNLNVGQTTSFDLFQIWTDNSAVYFDDTIPQSIFANFTLSQPVAAGTIGGTTVGIGGLLQFGSLTWGLPLWLSFGNGGLISLALSNETFNSGYFGLSGGSKSGATVKLSATYLSAPISSPTPTPTPTPTPAPVPLPAAGLGLIAALGGLGLFRRRAKRAA